MDKLRIFPAHHFKITVVVDKSFFFQVCCTKSQSFEIHFMFLMAIQQNIHTHTRKRRSEKPRQTSFVGATNLITYFNFVGFVNTKKHHSYVVEINLSIPYIYIIKFSFSEKKKKNVITFVCYSYLWIHFLNKYSINSLMKKFKLFRNNKNTYNKLKGT